MINKDLLIVQGLSFGNWLTLEWHFTSVLVQIILGLSLKLTD